MRSNFTALTFAWSNILTQTKEKTDQKAFNCKKSKFNDFYKFRNVIISKFGISVLNFVSKHIEGKSNIILQKEIVISKPKEDANIKASCIFKISDLNSTDKLNYFLEEINNNLNKNDLFIGFINTKRYKKLKLHAKYPSPINFFVSLYFSIISFFNKKSEYSFISKAELFGRLYYKGFEIIDSSNISTRLFFVAKKINKAKQEKRKYNSIIKLKRIGLNGKNIEVYKLRSMYPYSEYLQEYIYKENNLKAGGKFRNDFRISPFGKTIRKLWIDEIPMIYNILKGDIKLFGVRPLSNQYYQLYPEELKRLRIKTKPGLIPPFYADMPKTLEEIIESEMNYLNKYMVSPVRTDFIYFFKALNNILIKGNRSN